MKPFRSLDAVAAPMGTPNIDTDQIIPARYLWRSKADGYGMHLFQDLRFAADGTPREEFVLNQPAYANAGIIVAGRNFGCGSSREAAVWALSDYGVRCVIAPSFGDIFYNNSFKNGLLPIVLPPERVAALLAALDRKQDVRIEIDLQAQTVTGPGGTVDHFEVDPFRKQLLLEGMDDIAFTLRHTEQMAAFETEYDRAAPWLAVPG
ncbi:MAG: 3-isopropylmalate dehydratase small subunit [Proteobacteria bacterium]|nr:3-isopropylmalate dehydratase small subunit [Pseudomonadota bacterium]